MKPYDSINSLLLSWEKCQQPKLFYVPTALEAALAAKISSSFIF